MSNECIDWPTTAEMAKYRVEIPDRLQPRGTSPGAPYYIEGFLVAGAVWGVTASGYFDYLEAA
jgi:hypothetical protein